MNTRQPNNLAPDHHKRRRLTILLSLLFAGALVMGPGPGLYLVNPDPADPSDTFVWAGVPVIYLWAVLWFTVQAAVVLIAYRYLWQGDGPATEDPRK